MKNKVVDEQELIQRAKANFKTDYEAFRECYDEMIEDLYFGQGIGQWPDAVRIQRETDKRPCLRINKIPQFVDRVLGDLRQARPSIKIRPMDDKADPETADIITGIMRNIESQSDAETVYDSGAEAMVRCGYGAWRVITDYISNDVSGELDDSIFDQEIRIERIKNQFSVILDSTAKRWDRSDGRRAFVYEDMPRETFKKRWPGKDPCDFKASGKDLGNWATEDMVRVAEYWERESDTKSVYMILVDGEETPRIVTTLPKEPHAVIKERKAESSEITWYRISGKEILEGPIKLQGKYIPIVPCYGKETNIEGKSYYNGIIRHAKDSQRLYNYFRSYDAETIALAPKAPWLVTAKMIGDFKGMWKQANERNFPYLVYNPDPMAPGGKPERNIPNLSNQAITQQIMIADQELHDTTGLQLASLGKKSNEKSGRAIEARAKEGDVGQYTYADNLVRAIKHTARIIIDLLPYIYDTARVLRIIGDDQKSENIQVNAEFEDKKTGKSKIFDLQVGKYDVTASVGPSYQTQRQETQSALIEFAAILDPQQRMVITDMIASMSDWHNSDKLAKRLKKTIPPEIIQDEIDENEEPKPPPEPDPQQIEMEAMAKAKMENEMEMAEVELAIKKAELVKAKAEAATAEAEAALREADATDRANGVRPESKTAA